MSTQFQMESHSDVPKSHDAWVARLYTAFQEDRIHCPGCLSQERLDYEWSIRLLEKKSDRTPHEEEELKFDRLKINFLDFICKKVYEKTEKKKEAVIQAWLALNRAKQPLLVIPAAPAADVSTQLSAVEEDLYC